MAKQFILRLDETEHAKIKARAAELDTSIHQYLLDLIRDDLRGE